MANNSSHEWARTQFVFCHSASLPQPLCVCFVCLSVCSRFSWARPSIKPLTLLHSVSFSLFLIVPVGCFDILIPRLLIVLLFPFFYILTSPSSPLQSLTQPSLKALPPPLVLSHLTSPPPPPLFPSLALHHRLHPSLSLSLPPLVFHIFSASLSIHTFYPICPPFIHLSFHLILTSLLLSLIFLWQSPIQITAVSTNLLSKANPPGGRAWIWIGSTRATLPWRADIEGVKNRINQIKDRFWAFPAHMHTHTIRLHSVEPPATLHPLGYAVLGSSELHFAAACW